MDGALGRKMKGNIKAVLIGAGVGCILTLLAIGIPKVAQRLRDLGALVVVTDQVVRDSIKKDGIKLPEEAYSMYYARIGFQDYTTWIRFSMPRERIEPFIREMLNLGVTDLKEGLPSEYKEEIYQNENQKQDLSWWAPDRVRSPRIWRKNDRIIETWVVDISSGTFYICRHDY